MRAAKTFLRMVLRAAAMAALAGNMMWLLTPPDDNGLECASPAALPRSFSIIPGKRGPHKRC